MLLAQQGDIIVNATALDSSGALTILKQFIDSIPQDCFNYIIFVHPNTRINVSQSNVHLITKDVKSLLLRFTWDLFGLNNWLKKNNISPVATISLQNTNFRNGKRIPNFIYFHNSIPFFPKRWNPLLSNQRTLWFYKWIYPLFVKLLINSETEVFVQSNHIRVAFSTFFDFPKERIHIVRPKIEIPFIKKPVTYPMDRSVLNLFYPSTPFVYKNHLTIFRAIDSLTIDIQKKITLFLTCREEELLPLIKGTRISANIEYLGIISFEKMQAIYKNADALLFPSYIETLGLPLVEAASVGMPILVSDLQYAHEVLEGYEGATYIPYNESTAWGIEIIKLRKNNRNRFKPFSVKHLNSWPELFRIMKYKINAYVQG
jgi:glycosyltransferase involved in cell wall biosynthesis